MKTLQNKLSQMMAHYNHLQKNVKEEQEQLEKLRKEVNEIEQAREIIQTVAAQIQETAHSRIANVVTKCLEAVFDDPYTFRIEFEKKRGKTEAKLLFVRDGKELDPVTSAGGGCLDIAGMALRLACLVLSKPRKRKVLILDEPFRNISPQYRPLVPQMLNTLAEELKVQIIFTTNFLEYVTGKVIDLRKEK